ncbi:MAG: biopolymer transporter ExbD [Rhodobiaceae bacterium]|nr:biopolymer transporter ExbD [Rhodobiaceae bacterium]MCC0056158.1 biopolymer transporter ExbD [Rhodobiaceae bacterium]
MRVDYAIRRSRRLTLTPLIDIIFLLLLFFMLSSTFTRFAQIELTAGKSGAASTRQQPDILIRLDEQGVSINGRLVDEGEAGSTIATLHAAGGKTVAVLVRGEVNAQRLVTLIEDIRRVGNLDVTIVK